METRVCLRYFVSYCSSYITFFQKNVAVAVLHTYTNQTSVLPTAKFRPAFNK